MVISWGLSLWGILFYGGVSCAYPLHYCRDRSAFEIYLFKHESKNNLGEKGAWDTSAHKTERRKRWFFLLFFSETPRFQPGAGRGSCLWALWLVTNDIIPRAGPPPIPTMSSVPKHVSDVMQGGPLQAAPHFLFHFSLLSLFVCLSSLLRIAQIKKNLSTQCVEICPKAIKKLLKGSGKRTRRNDGRSTFTFPNPACVLQQ